MQLEGEEAPKGKRVSKNDEFVSKKEELCIKNNEFCIKNEELCIKNEELRVKNDDSFSPGTRRRSRKNLLQNHHFFSIKSNAIIVYSIYGPAVPTTMISGESNLSRLHCTLLVCWCVAQAARPAGNNCGSPAAGGARCYCWADAARLTAWGQIGRSCYPEVCGSAVFEEG